MSDLEKATEDVDLLVELLSKQDWRERQFLTDAEAIGTPIRSGGAKKRKAVEHEGGALSKFASEASMRHLQTVGLIKSVLVRKVDSNFQLSQGRMRLWSLDDILRAELAFSLAELGDLPLLTVGAILKSLPGSSHGSDVGFVDIVTDLSFIWSAYIGAEYLSSQPYHALNEDGFELNSESPENPLSPKNQPSDVRIIVVDRRWVFGFGFNHPMINSKHLEPLAEIASYKNASPKVELLLNDRDNFQNEEGVRMFEARSSLERSVSKLELNLTAPLRRFLHRNNEGIKR